MLGIGGKFAGAKGMVAVPDLSNKTPDEALALLQAAGLTRSTFSSSNTSNSGLNNKVFQQSIAAGSLVDYESSVSYDYYTYVAPAAPPIVSCGTYLKTIDSGFTCSGEGRQDFEKVQNYVKYCYQGSTSVLYELPAPDSTANTYYSPSATTYSKYPNNGCGCCTCTPTYSLSSSWSGSCSGGSKIFAWRVTNSCIPNDTGTVYSTTVSCCSSIGCGSTYKVSTGTWTYDLRQDCYSDNSNYSCNPFSSSTGNCSPASSGSLCSKTTKTVGSGCEPHCDIWRDVTSCTGKCGTTKKQSQKCQASDCSYYYNYRTLSCPC